MVNVLGGARERLAVSLADVADPEVKVHLYGKEVRPGRKVGHVTVLGDSYAEALQRGRIAADIVRDGAASAGEGGAR